MPPELDASLTALGVQDEIRSLLRSYRAVLESGRDPQTMLRRITEIAVEISDAEFGAIGITGPDGLLEEFITVGMPEDEVQRLGDPPQGHGLLGTLIDEQQALIVDDMLTDPRSVGFPAGHPGMRSFLGAPIRVREGAYANFYLTHSEPGRFDGTHLEALQALSETVSLAIDFAIATADARAKDAWSAAVIDVTGALLAENSEEALGVLADHVMRLADADAAAIVTPLGTDSAIVELVHGLGAARGQGAVVQRSNSILGRVFDSGQPVNVVGGGRASPLGWDALVAVPLIGGGQTVGVLAAARAEGRRPFTATDVALVADFAGQASVAMVLAGAREARARLAVLDDRARIARDLHDHVIQRIFAAGLNLQAASTRLADSTARREIQDQIVSLDRAIQEIRTAIFAMTNDGAERPSVRHRIIDEVGAVAQGMPSSPLLSFSGAIDLLVPEPMLEDILAVVREGLTNVAKHAGQTREVTIRVTATDDDIEVAITDDGTGLPERLDRRSGTSNLHERAESWGGAFALDRNEPHGTRLVWRAPYRRED